MEMVDLSASLDIELNQISEFKQIKHKSRGCCYFIFLFLLGQLYCLLYSCMGMLVTEMSNHKANMPFFNSFLCSLLVLIYAKCKKPRKTDDVRFVDYLVPTIFDSLCVILNQIAYSQTSMASNDLMNSFSIVVAAGLSYFMFRLKYRWAHYIGLAFTLIGMGVIYFSDSQKGGVQMGDLIGLGSSTCSAISLVFQERVLNKGMSTTEYLAKAFEIELIVGILGFIFTSEYEIMLQGNFNFLVICEILGYAGLNLINLLVMFLILEKYGATSFTLVSLFSVVYSMLFDVFLFGKPFHFLEVVGYVSIITGVVVFHLREPNTPKPAPLLEGAAQ